MANNWIVKFNNKGMTFSSDYARATFLDFKTKNPEFAYKLIPTKIGKRRTSQQNNALHLWFSWVARELNEAGYSVKVVLSKKLEVDWNTELVKEILWRTAQRSITSKKSTTELNKMEEIDLIYNHLNRHLGEKFGIYVPFPDAKELEKIDSRFIANK
jgi:hypothetical protein